MYVNQNYAREVEVIPELREQLANLKETLELVKRDIEVEREKNERMLALQK